MFKKIVKGLTLFAAVIAVTFVSSSVVKADIEYEYCECANPTEGYRAVEGSEDRLHVKICTNEGCGKRISGVQSEHHAYNDSYHCTLCGQKCSHGDIRWFTGHNSDFGLHIYGCYDCSKYKIESHTMVKSYEGGNDGIVYCIATGAENGHGDKCYVCAYHNNVTPKSEEKKEDKKEETKHEEPARDLAKEAFGGRAPEALSLTEQMSAVSYALNNLRAGGFALPANTVKASGTNNGSSDIAAVVADNRDAINQQVFAQVMCQNLGFKNITPLKTYNMYALHATYDAKTKAQTITWANTGLKFGDTAFVVWYNQKLGKIELLPAVVGPNGDVAVSVPALGDVSTMTVVKAN